MTYPAIEIKLAAEFRAKLDSLADQKATEPAALAQMVLERYLDVFDGHLSAIAEGIDDGDAGRVVDHDQVVAWIESWDSEQELERPI